MTYISTSRKSEKLKSQWQINQQWFCFKLFYILTTVIFSSQRRAISGCTTMRHAKSVLFVNGELIYCMIKGSRRYHPKYTRFFLRSIPSRRQLRIKRHRNSSLPYSFGPEKQVTKFPWADIPLLCARKSRESFTTRDGQLVPKWTNLAEVWNGSILSISFPLVIPGHFLTIYSASGPKPSFL